MAHDGPALRVEDLIAGYGGLPALHGVSLEVKRGEIVALVGANGAGKSTLLRAIAGLLPAESGKVYTDGQPSLLGVNAALMNDLTGERNVILGGLAMGTLFLVVGRLFAPERRTKRRRVELESETEPAPQLVPHREARSG